MALQRCSTRGNARCIGRGGGGGGGGGGRRMMTSEQYMNTSSTTDNNTRPIDDGAMTFIDDTNHVLLPPAVGSEWLGRAGV